jgi:RNA polymerase sigma factor (sigma-70 family)
VLPHLNSAQNLARWLVCDPTLAENVVRDALLRALSYCAKFQGDDVRSWLLQIVHDVAYTALEKRAVLGQKESLKLPKLDDLETGPSKLPGLKPLERKLFALPLELRECLVLRELEGCSYKEIARVTETPIGTVMSRLWRARQTLLGLSKESEP